MTKKRGFLCLIGEVALDLYPTLREKMGAYNAQIRIIYIDMAYRRFHKTAAKRKATTITPAVASG